ncbi:hypothetical protein LGH70_05965 [Hymenobacter sp. BT635]|uniref:General stress protein n=1 Tax=Hymenobacter nitidus TaxID=2880929 RepID=A0ABS8A9P5_9BACT|nr:hypothetical protein [Hymenobacter nitidus]MCB2377118.1 hypothetical protein [Hymenobacter nitidus]
MSKQALIKRLSTYYPLERAHAFFTFPLLAAYLFFRNPLPAILFLEYGVAVCIFILLQGQHYWKLKLYRLTNRPFDAPANLLLFRRARRINVVLILLMPVVFYAQLQLAGHFRAMPDLFGWAFLANGFAILEHINYYHIQLSIDNKADVRYVLHHKKLKTASLKKDLLENEL